MKKDILDEYEYLLSDLLTVIGTLKIVHRWLDDKLDYYEFERLKAQHADVLCLAIGQLDYLTKWHQEVIAREYK